LCRPTFVHSFFDQRRSNRETHRICARRPRAPRLLGARLYGGLIIRRALNAPNYKPVLEDWICHVALPLLAYGALLVAALTLPRRPASSLFVVGAAALLLLLVGIHNAWDTVTYLAIDRARKQEDLDQ
jgi:hypothetical protein